MPPSALPARDDGPVFQPPKFAIPWYGAPMPTWTATQPEPRVIAPKSPEAAVLGRDIAFPRGDYVVGTHGDYQTIEGEGNVRASLERRLISPLGSFVFRPTYGGALGNQVNRPMDTGTVDLTRNRLRDQSKADSRVRSAAVTIERRGIDTARVVVKARLRQVPRDVAAIEFAVG